MTRLAFGAQGGSEVPVDGLEVPITFTLPRAPLENGTSAKCTFWSEADKEFRTQGCTQLPNPLPFNHSAFWIADAKVIDDEDIHSIWNITGPMVRCKRVRRFVILLGLISRSNGQI